MKAFISSVILTLLGATSITVAQINMPNPAAPGLSPQSAIRLVSTSDLMLDRTIKRWLMQHYPGWDAEPHEFMEIGSERYAVVYITSANNSGRRIYFRVSNGAMGDDDNAGSFPGFPRQ
jgi:hypothetical protein